MLKKAIAEFAGTFLLVLFGCGSVCMHLFRPADIANLGIALSFGVIVMAGILIFSRISGAHMNPAVSIYFWVLRKLESKELAVYILSQFAGATLAALALYGVFPTIEHHGSTFPHAGDTLTWILEFGLTFILIIAIAFLHEATRNQVAIAIGGVIFLEAFIFGPLTGASMNPARSFGPLLIDGNLHLLWIYASSQVLAALLAGFLVLKFRKKELG